jgi:SAM-dependent methyltransferase
MISTNPTEPKDHGVPRPGLLSPHLSRLRRRRALLLLRNEKTRETILDIGCGRYPAFLEQAPYERKSGLDRLGWSGEPLPGIEIVKRELEEPQALPWPDAAFDAVTMLAVMEHVTPERVKTLLADIHRIMRPGGALVITVPTPFGDRFLHFISRFGLTSRENLNEHKDRYTAAKLRALLAGAGFAPAGIRAGRFMLGLNHWAFARR